MDFGNKSSMKNYRSSYVLTHLFGWYRFHRLPFEISLAPEMYHKAVHVIFEHIEGVDTSMDDIIVYGSTLEEHNERLMKVFQEGRRSNLKQNKDKCVFGVHELTFLGDVIADD